MGASEPTKERLRIRPGCSEAGKNQSLQVAKNHSRQKLEEQEPHTAEPDQPEGNPAKASPCPGTNRDARVPDTLPVQEALGPDADYGRRTLQAERKRLLRLHRRLRQRFHRHWLA